MAATAQRVGRRAEVWIQRNRDPAACSWQYISRQTMPKASKNTRRGWKWEPSDVIELLAYLDFCLDREISFESTVEAHLKTATGKDITNKDALARLKVEWLRFGRDGPGTVQDLFSEGLVVSRGL